MHRNRWQGNIPYTTKNKFALSVCSQFFRDRLFLNIAVPLAVEFGNNENFGSYQIYLYQKPTPLAFSSSSLFCLLALLELPGRMIAFKSTLPRSRMAEAILSPIIPVIPAMSRL